MTNNSTLETTLRMDTAVPLDTAIHEPPLATAGVVADGGAEQLSKFTTHSGESPNVRRVLVDLHDEYARHVGHADLLREAVDGLVGEDLPQS